MEISKQDRKDSDAHVSPARTRGRPKKMVTPSKHSAKRVSTPRCGHSSDDASLSDDENADEEDNSCDDDADMAPGDYEASNENDPPIDAASLGGTGKPKDPLNILNNDLHLSQVNAHGHFQDSKAPGHSRKRTLSQSNIVSVLGETSPNASSPNKYPRNKLYRRLSNNNGLFTYDDSSVDAGKTIGNASAADSDDDDYAAVEMISDSESEAEIEKREKKALAQESDDDDSDAASELDLGMDPNSVSGFFDEQMDLMPEDSNLMLYRVASPLPRTPAPRKVHFDETPANFPSSSDTSSDTADIPDLFTTANVNILTMQNTAGYETFYSPAHSDGSSYWDWQDDDFSQSAAQSMFTASEIDGTSTGNGSTLHATDYGAASILDTETGDTTEEDMPPPPPPDVTPKAVLRSHKPAPRRSTRRRSDRPVRSLPRLGTFKPNPNKAWAIYKKGIGIIMHPPKDPKHELARFWPPRSGTSSTVQSSPSTPFHNFTADESDYSDVTRSAFSGAHGADFMLSGLFGGDASATYHFGGQVIGPPEAFFPFKSVNSSGSVHSWDDDEDYEEEDSAEEQIDLNDLLQLDDDDDDDDDNNARGVLENTDGNDALEPTSPAGTETSSAMTPFHSHSNSFNGASEWTGFSTPSYSVHSGVVNSFRNNQDRAKRLSSMQQTPAERASSMQAIRNGHAGNSFISPIRKRKPSQEDSPFAMPDFSARASASKIDKRKKRKSPFRLPRRGFFGT